MQKYKIYSYLESLQDEYKGSTERAEGLVRSPREIIRTIEFYTNNKFLSGNLDSLGREKPFYNVCNYRVTVAKTATDLDVKDIKYEPDNLDDSIAAFLINHELYKYLKESNFSLTLNKMGITRPKYGGLLVKKTERKGKLNIEVVDWLNVEFDPGDVLGGSIIETHYMQPSELSAMDSVWYDVQDVLKAHEKQTKNKPEKIEIKEIEGEFPESYDPENENDPKYYDSGKYKRMCFYIACVGNKKFFLYKEDKKESSYKYLPWEAEGKGLGRGVVEDGFESQVWINDAMISMKNAMELSGKAILASDSQKVSGNAITGIDNGHIFELEPGRTITSLNLAPSALPQFQNIIELWNQQYDRTASTYDANTGEAPTAGTPYSQTALLNQVANSPFEYRREEWGIFLNEILNDWIMPYLKRKITRPHYLTSEFDGEELEMIDEAIITKAVNSEVVKIVLSSDTMVTEQDREQIKLLVREKMRKNGNKREVEIPEGFLDVQGKLTANITGELKNKASILQSLDNIFKTVVSTFNPQTGQYAALEDPVLSRLFGQIVEMAGVPIGFYQLQGKGRAVETADVSAVQNVTPVQ